MRKIDQVESEAITTFCAFLADGVEQIRGNAVSEAILMHLKTWGAVLETGGVATVWCDECEVGHLATVIQNPAGDDLGWMCPEIGFVSAAARELRAFEVQLDKIARSLREEFTDPRSFDKLGHRTGIWRLGQRPIEKGRVEILLMSRLNSRSDVDRLANSARHLPPAHTRIVLVAAASDETLEQCMGWHLFPLRDLFEVRGSRLRINAEEFDLRIMKLLLQSPAARSGRPSQKEMTRRALKWLESRSMLESGRNAKVRQLQQHWPEIFEGERAPPKSTLEKHVSGIIDVDAGDAL